MTGGDILLHERFVKRAITIKEVSEKTNISKERISAIELNNKMPTFEEINILNRFYGLELKMQDFQIIPRDKLMITTDNGKPYKSFYIKRKRR